MKFVVVAAVAVFFIISVFAASSVQGQSSCTSVLISLSPCLNYISGNSSSPSPSCCQQLANVVSSQPRCLCQVLNGGGGPSLGVPINQTRAIALPNACKIQTPPISRCNGGTPTTTSPTTGGGSSGGGTADSPSSINVPTTEDGSSDGYRKTKVSFGLMMFVLFTSFVYV